MTSVVKALNLQTLKTGPIKLASFFVFIGLIFSALTLSGCDFRDNSLTPIRIAGGTMGTTYSLTVMVSRDRVEPARESLRAKIEAELDKVNQEMSTYIGDSELMRVNARAPGEWVAVSAGLFQVLNKSLQVARMTSGAFDITVGPLVEIWGFGASMTGDKIPSAERITALLQQTGFKKLQLDASSNSIFKSETIRLDLSAIAKGHGADRVAGILDRDGYQHYLVEIGGEMRLKGNSPRGEAWKIGIESPTLMQGNTQKAIAITNKGIATSGNYRNFFEVDGKRYSHTIDPRTGWPVTHQLASVTVIADSTAEADALATAFSVLGVTEAVKVADAYKVAAFFVQREGDAFVESHSAEFEQYLK
jgi:thiamine biosynthesis lipoprotein